jgi:hypothetical protein
MQNLEGSGTPVLYIGRTVLKKLSAGRFYCVVCLCITMGLRIANVFWSIIDKQFCSRTLNIFLGTNRRDNDMEDTDLKPITTCETRQDHG